MAEDAQLERRIAPEMRRGFREFYRISDSLKNRIAGFESERQVAELNWGSAKLDYDGADRTLTACQLYAHLIGIQQEQKILSSRASFVEILPAYSDGFEFDESILNEAVIRSLLSKIPLTREEFNTLETRYKNQAFVISRLSTARAIRRVQENMAEHLKRGGGFGEWRDQMDEMFASLGMEPQNSYYLENVYRTNVSSAYNAARWEQAQASSGLIALLEYHAILDARTRPNHRAMDGTKAPPDAQIWIEWYPPNGYRCRCRVVSITKYAAQRYGLKADIVYPDVKPDPGFEYNPSQGLPPQFLNRAQEFGIPVR